MPRLFVPALLLAALLANTTAPVAQVAPAAGSALTLAPAPADAGVVPAAPVRFAVLGDTGTGETPQYDVARQMVQQRTAHPFSFVLMVGDNLYGRASPRVYREVFERPYKALLDAGVRFYAVLGNHDDPASREYAGFNMNGQRYYTYARGDVRFFGLDTNALEARQLAWFEGALKASTERWKIVYFHHAIYSNGRRHGSDVELRVLLEPLLVRYGVNVVFAGHDHHYERFKPQKGVTYFVTGSGGKLRKGFRTSDQSAAVFDQDQAFMLVEIAGDALSFRAISRIGRVVDSGVLYRRPTT